MLPRGIVTARPHKPRPGEARQGLHLRDPDPHRGPQVVHRHVSPLQSTSSRAAKLFSTLTQRTLKSWRWKRATLSGWSRNWTMPGSRESFAERRGCSRWIMWKWSSRCPRSAPASPRQGLRQSRQIWIQSFAEQIWISLWIKFGFLRGTNLYLIVKQIWISLGIKFLSSHCSKYFWTLWMCRNEIQFASWRPEKIWFLAAYPCILNQSLVSSVASHGKQDLRRKSFRFLSQCLSDFCEISVKICSPWNSGISLGKKMGKTVLPACGSFPNWEHTIHVHSVIFGRECK